MIVELDSNSGIDSANEGKLIFIKGRIQVSEPLTEPEYGVTIPAVKLKRRVQMYQWVEVQPESNSWWGVSVDEESPVTYMTTWRDKLVDSSLFVQPFGHANPKTFPVESGVSVSETVKVGPYMLGRELKQHFHSFTLLTSDQRPERRDIKMHSGLYYHSFDVWNPEVGDTRVQLSYAGAPDDMVTILACQVGASLQPFYLDSRDLTVVLEGEHSLSDTMTTKFPSSGAWLIRIPAYFAVYCAYSSLTFMFYLAGRGSRLVHAFVTHNNNVISVLLTAITVFTVTGVAWIHHSPLLGSTNLLVSVLLIGYSVYKGYSLYYFFTR